ncbi:MAG: 2-amino-4-hydroxy-6-hydroxymethyldihydropteridine diphosphokinase [Candidatus Gracilibacteria bacterium]
MRIFLGLGSNLGEKDKNLILAKDLLMKNDVLIVGQSSVLETKPLYGLNQPDYLNQVVECTTELKPEELLVVCKKIEKEMGRPVAIPGITNVQFLGKKVGELGKNQSAKGKNESRTCDIDILFYGGKIIDTEILTIPHRGILGRDFVLSGLKELAPDFVHPVLKKPLKALVLES